MVLEEDICLSRNRIIDYNCFINLSFHQFLQLIIVLLIS